MQTKVLLIATALIELGAGLALLCDPAGAAQGMSGTPLNDAATVTLLRIGGAGLLSLAVACWLARNDAHSPAARGLVIGMLVYNVAAAGLLGYAGLVLKLPGTGIWFGVGLHVVMTTWCLACLRTARPRS